MRYLRTNTATRITVGPFLDKTDGITPEVALTVTDEKLTFVVDTAGVPTLVLDVAPTAAAGANDMVHITGDDSGFYDLELAAADVNYLGRAMLSLNNVAVHCPVFHEFMILPAMIYDAMVLGTDVLQADVTQLLGTAWLAPAVAGTPDVNTKTITAGAVGAAAIADGAIDAATFAAGAINAAAIADAAIDAATFASGAINAAAIAADAIGASELAADAATEIAAAVWGSDATSYQAQGTFGQAIGDPVADTNTIYKAVVTDATAATVGLDVVANAAALVAIDDFVDAEVAAILAAVDTEVGLIKAQTDKLAFTVANQVDANVLKVAGTTQTAGDIIADTNDIQARLPAALTANGNIKSSLVEILTTAITETGAGYLAAGFKKLLDIVTPVFTLASVNQTGDSYAKVDTEVGTLQTDVTEILTRIPDATAGAAGGLAIVGSKMDIVDAPTATGRDAIAGAVWDVALTGILHNGATTAGRRLRQLTNAIMYEGTVASATSNTVTFPLGSNTNNNVYRHNLIVILSGLGVGQSRVIVEYVGGTTRKATVDRPWVVIPSAADEVAILAFGQELVVAFGTVVASSSTSLRLSTDASATNDMYNYNVIVVTSASGVAETEARLITDYDGATQTVTVSPAWTATPAIGASYKIIPVGRSVTESMSVDAIGGPALAATAIQKIWDALTTNLTTTDSIGKLLVTDVDAKVSDIPTNAELATALGTADDAVLAAIAALNNLSQANIRTAVGLASANLDTQLADLPTNAELAVSQAAADDATLAAISALSAQIGNIGTGAVSWAVTVTDNSGNPIDGVDVWVTSDEAGTGMVARGQTDALGLVTFQLDPGTYWFWKQLSGYTFTNPQEVVVS